MSRNSRSNPLKNIEVRRSARMLAVQFLCSLDIYPEQDFDGALELFFAEGSRFEDEKPGVREYFRWLVCGIRQRRPEIDEILSRVVTGWRPERLFSVDRSVLRLAIYEGFLEKKLPYRAMISEALKIAAILGVDQSPRFVNGVLVRVARSLSMVAER